MLQGFQMAQVCPVEIGPRWELPDPRPASPHTSSEKQTRRPNGRRAQPMRRRPQRNKSGRIHAPPAATGRPEGREAQRKVEEPYRQHESGVPSTHGGLTGASRSALGCFRVTTWVLVLGISLMAWARPRPS